MVSYHRPKSGHITCYLNRTYHVLLTESAIFLDNLYSACYPFALVDLALHGCTGATNRLEKELRRTSWSVR
jgi:hypothetical protein